MKNELWKNFISEAEIESLRPFFLLGTIVEGHKTDEEKLKLFKSDKFMAWWIRASAELIRHWYSIEENISSPVLTKERSEP